MGTRSTIAIQEGDGFRGRYCHWDGYPTWMAKALTELIQRDGHAKVLDTILSKPSWSSIDPKAPREPDRLLQRPMVEGYGSYHDDLGDGDYWNTFGPKGFDEQIGGTEWAYAINPANGRVSVFKVGRYDPKTETYIEDVTLLGSFDPYTVDPSEFERLEAVAYGE